MFRIFFGLSFFVATFAHAQIYPQNYFQSPLNIPLALSGTFGELRGNHFHAGFDIKTQGREGLPVFAPADGQIVRIKVSAYGYGKALYVAHPNGYTTVYGHLKSFSPEVEEWVKKQQYAKESFEVNLFPPAGKFKVVQGEEFATSGNTGGSGGPHLHFEIRDSKTEETINPALFGLPVSDKKKPYIAHLFAKPISAGATVSGRSNTTEIALKNLGNGVFEGSINASGIVGLVLHTFDQQDLSNNHNGIFKIDQYVNDTANYSFTIDRFEFRNTRYINAHMDFARYKTNRQLAHKCYVEPGNKLPSYSNLKNNGLIDASAGSNKEVQLVVTDSWGNRSEIRLKIKGVNQDVLQTAENKKFDWNTAHTIKLDGVKIYLPSATLYNDEEIAVTTSPPCANCETDVYKIGDVTIPSHKRYSLSIQRGALEKSEKLVWAVMNGKGSGSGLTTKWKGDWLTARPREFGKFAIMQDLKAPVLNVKHFAKGTVVKKGGKVAMTASDNLSGITFYEARIDGKWVLLKHQANRNYFWHDFESNLEAGSHVLTLTFKDEVGNITSFETVFTYAH